MPDDLPRSRVLVGTASWTDRSLLTSGWYPPDAATPAARLAYYASRFPLVEVDATYYNPPSLRTAEAWRDRTPDGFTFDVKAFSLLTGHPTRRASLYKDLRERLGTAKETLYLRDVGPAIAEEVWDRFLGALAPLHEAGKLGIVLLQFPPWFGPGERNREYLLRCVERCRPMRAGVEFRNAGWMTAEHRDHTLGLLAAHDIPYVAVDMPQGYPSSVPPVLAATADLAVVRFHGHSGKWDSKRIEERFGYLYSEEELRGWAADLAGLAARARTVHVLMNNCCADNAQRNAAFLASLLESAPVGG
ncbi:hypothetical protein Sme01_56500 [Sphaerisporangium melleum]|uniref:DUF72 domain-containing protein n=1 Tax=Sphaerisporangium melleum TaxID=321316 RepID=A0A917RGU3_9ACTN|nr:DUF72 domain-containing protein [Sphaerisporangium melleum]GGL05689.1 hypothetical protein GCM10007964_54930 [Sphaerisporangium melleum]GII73174.1 hypothetical protein Sme01_56500 [Sphaerisporangium melleum]